MQAAEQSHLHSRKSVPPHPPQPCPRLGSQLEKNPPSLGPPAPSRPPFSAQQEPPWSPAWGQGLTTLHGNSELSERLSAFAYETGRTPSLGVTIRAAGQRGLDGETASAEGGSVPRTHCTKQDLPFLRLWPPAGDAQVGVGTSQAGPQEADSFPWITSWSAACWHHTPCVSLREAHWPVLRCLRPSYPHVTLGTGGVQSRCPREPALWASCPLGSDCTGRSPVPAPSQ